ncbi:helix-turn-helix domain-containing protein [Streptomyces europaeiscabiei]|uniref:helix-turn-helix domain-containing protein n=1 Tax=Streptomyces europaeiscabiei TaxID=146819 RepID=UPI0029BB73FA|nr:helix-turn-helix domain-containing protein [Streptomyces europaeiscabiei]MDX2760415.1 helix-turn-helix domain-containing protein [Streptomyces europaeiscabiei]
MGNVHEDPLSELGLRLRTLRAQRGLQVKGLVAQTRLGRTTVSQALGGKVVPSEATLVALARALNTEARPLLELRQDAVHGRGQDRQLRRRQPSTGRHAAGHQARDAARERPGRLVRELRDPFDLEVQRAIDVSGDDSSDPLPVLPVYVEREHDALLHETVLGALEGRSALVTLIGGSSTGKTRACWEAVQLLPDEWRLWHPIAPSHTDAVLAGLAEVGSHTVLWLNEVQHYLLTSDPAVGERVAAGLRELLRTPERGPVLALATAHPEDWARLTATSAPRDDYPQVRALLTGAGVRARIPDQFICDPAVLEEAAQADPRVAEASAVAIDGRLTQYLAGVPALLERVGLASQMARCLVIAAVQLRRLGHGPMLPLPGLEATAASLTPDHIWNEHARPGWFESALEYLSAPCRGVLGPLSPVQPRPGTPPPDQPLYQLSGYLFEIGRYELRHDCPPAAFWAAALQHAYTDEDRRALATSAYERGRVRLSASVSDGRDLFGLYDRGSSYVLGQEADRARAENALATISEQRASGQLQRNAVLAYFYQRQEAHHLDQLGEHERAAAIWRELADQGHPDAFVHVGRYHLEFGRRTEAERWFRQGAEAGDDDAMQELVFLLAEDGLFDEAAEWTERIARPTESGDIYAYSRLAYRYKRAGNLTQAKIYFRKAIDAGLVDCYQELIELHLEEGDIEGARRLYAEAIEAGETSAPMMRAEEQGEHAKADELAFTARDRGRSVGPLQFLLWHRLQRPDTVGLGTALARTVIDAGDAFVVQGVASELSAAGHHRAVEALQRIFDEVDESVGQ